MKKQKLVLELTVDNTHTLSIEEICQEYRIPEDLLQALFEEGLFHHEKTPLQELRFTMNELSRLESAFRLHQDLGINLPGVVLALELLEKIDKLDEELHVLRRNIST